MNIEGISLQCVLDTAICLVVLALLAGQACAELGFLSCIKCFLVFPILSAPIRTEGRSVSEYLHCCCVGLRASGI